MHLLEPHIDISLVIGSLQDPIAARPSLRYVFPSNGIRRPRKARVSLPHPAQEVSVFAASQAECWVKSRPARIRNDCGTHQKIAGGMEERNNAFAPRGYVEDAAVANGYGRLFFEIEIHRASHDISFKPALTREQFPKPAGLRDFIVIDHCNEIDR